jgi:hypothetical protein
LFGNGAAVYGNQKVGDMLNFANSETPGGPPALKGTPRRSSYSTGRLHDTQMAVSSGTVISVILG